MTRTAALSWLAAQQAISYQKKGATAQSNTWDLQNMHKFSQRLGHPHTAFQSIHVAGTNGKGSTSHMMASILQEAGYKVGLFTSPHLHDFRERIRIDGAEISQDACLAFAQKHQQFVGDLGLSFFEFTVGLAFDYFAAQSVDIAIVEVGLGGRLDATNIIVPAVSVITNIGFDHVHLLGTTLPKIASEKAGIIKKNIPVVYCGLMNASDVMN